jgi:hypothetical protein
MSDQNAGTLGGPAEATDGRQMQSCSVLLGKATDGRQMQSCSVLLGKALDDSASEDELDLVRKALGKLFGYPLPETEASGGAEPHRRTPPGTHAAEGKESSGKHNIPEPLSAADFSNFKWFTTVIVSVITAFVVLFLINLSSDIRSTKDDIRSTNDRISALETKIDGRINTLIESVGSLREDFARLQGALYAQPPGLSANRQTPPPPDDAAGMPPDGRGANR